MLWTQWRWITFRFPCVFGEFNSFFSRLLSFGYPFCFSLIISLYGWTYLRPLLRCTLFSLLICSYLCCHVIIIIIIIIIIISLRNEKRHSRHPYISKPNIKTIKSRKINFGDKFYIRGGGTSNCTCFTLPFWSPEFGAVSRFSENLWATRVGCVQICEHTTPQGIIT